MKKIPDKEILLFKSCLVSTEYPGIESSTKFIFDKLSIDYVINHEQSCCTGLGHYSDVFNQFSTTLIAARNFNLANKINMKNIVVMCATCYAINKKSCDLLNNNTELRHDINEIFNDSGIDEYKEDSIDLENNIFHVVEILYNKKEEISKAIMNNEINSKDKNSKDINSKDINSKKNKLDLSNIKISTHHACHFCKVSDNEICKSRNPKILDELVECCGVKTTDWYREKRTTCGAGFRQRFTNKDLSLAVTGDKLLALKEENIDILIHMCPNCHVQYDRYQPYIEKKLNTKFNTLHLNITQFIALVLGADPYKVVGIQTHTTSIEPLIEKLKVKSD